MKYAFAPEFLTKLPKLNVRVRNAFKVQLVIFSHNHNTPQLNNHPLRDPYLGFNSINVTNDYRAIYREMVIQEEPVAYFVDIDTHEALYGSKQAA